MDSNKTAPGPVATDKQVVNAMRAYGGSFVRQLAQLWLMADPMNQARLKEAFRDKFDEYRQVAHYEAQAEEASRRYTQLVSDEMARINGDIAVDLTGRN